MIYEIASFPAILSVSRTNSIVPRRDVNKIFILNLQDTIIVDIPLATGMMAIAKVKKGQTGIELDEVSELFDTALEAMQMRGKASLGDKTVLDVIVAVRDTSKNQADGQTMLNCINQAINDTMKLFQNRQSQIGRARIFGEKSIGLDDPGMLAFKRMFESLQT